MMEKELLQRGIRKLGLPFKEGRADLLLRYLVELERWNESSHFVKTTGREDLIVRHVLDSLAGVKAIEGLTTEGLTTEGLAGENRAAGSAAIKAVTVKNAGCRIIDVGSGAGFPGIPLAIFLESASFTLLERSAKRAAFLRNVIILLKLKNVSVLEQTLSELKESFDVVTFRALTPLGREIRVLMRIVTPGGSIVAYKGKSSRIREELEGLKVRIGSVSIEKVSVPFLAEERHLVLIRP